MRRRTSLLIAFATGMLVGIIVTIPLWLVMLAPYLIGSCVAYCYVLQPPPSPVPPPP